MFNITTVHADERIIQKTVFVILDVKFYSNVETQEMPISI